LNKGTVFPERRYNAIRDGALETLGIAYDQYRFSFDGASRSPELQIVNISGLKLQSSDVRLQWTSHEPLEGKLSAFVGARADMGRSLDNMEICKQITVGAYEKTCPGPDGRPIGV
jgi:hypothetical protein